ncbi:helix-turn-helix domain-containing protein [Streptomyces sp. NPDC004031]
MAARRRARGLTQTQLASAAKVSYAMVRAVERGARTPSDDVLDALAAALGVDPARLSVDAARTESRVHQAMPVLSAAIADYDVPAEGPVRSLPRLRAAVTEAVQWRLASQYVRLATEMPALLRELSRALKTADGRERPETARLLVAAYRAADAVAYKSGHHDLSARLVELMRWAAPQTDSEMTSAVVAYVRTETFFAARAHRQGLEALETALGSCPDTADRTAAAVRAALHMRAAVAASRASEAEVAASHLAWARRLVERVPEGIYEGTAVGPDSLRIHEVSVGLSNGGSGITRVLAIAQQWMPPASMPGERRSGFYIEVARAQLWAGQRTAAFDSLRSARRIAPQHTREHPWAREDTRTLRRLQRAPDPELTRFAEWIGAV